MLKSALVFFLASASLAQANVVATLSEQAGSVQFNVAGSINTDAFAGFSSSTGSTGQFTYLGQIGFQIAPGPGIQSTTYFLDDFYVGFASTGTSGSGMSGSWFGLFGNGIQDQLLVPATYVSGTPFTSVGSFPGDFASTGLTPGSTTVMTLPGDQTVTIQVQQTVVPLPAGLPLALGGLGALALIGLRRRRGV